MPSDSPREPTGSPPGRPGEPRDLRSLTAAYADGRIDRHAFIDAVAGWDFVEDSSSGGQGRFIGDVELPAAGSMADIDRAYVAGLIDPETYRDIHVARQLRLREREVNR